MNAITRSSTMKEIQNTSAKRAAMAPKSSRHTWPLNPLLWREHGGDHDYVFAGVYLRVGDRGTRVFRGMDTVRPARKLRAEAMSHDKISNAHWRNRYRDVSRFSASEICAAGSRPTENGDDFETVYLDERRGADCARKRRSRVSELSEVVYTMK